MSGSPIGPGESRTNTSVKVVTAKIDASKEQEIAKINMQKEIEVQRLKNEARLREAEIKKELEKEKSKLTKEVELAKNDTKKVLQQESNKMQSWWIMALIFLVFIVVIFTYLSIQKKRKDALKMHEEKLQHEAYLKEQEMKLKMAEKVLDTLASGNLSEENEQLLINSLQNTSETKQLKK